ncbi:reverse transcriptase-like protein [Paenisporosarcina antarctica]|uniref:Reverse transcriptase-like protein n=1 Tax=Paenisporosarcina antarctica TaxID=417367 RepID=A0A4P6ZX92_9BACL|nr:reverse transcriptase-like protein [Paenisporosarcina antarctica]QBP41240.1 reverse transcriptase-like protein [Paenisporosarcina antarctica]
MKIRIEWTYKTPKGEETVFISEEMLAIKGLLIAEDLERTGRAKNIMFIDKFDSMWTIKELKGYLKGIETEPHNITVYFDGGFDRGTNSSGLGCVIYYDQSGKSYRLRRNAAMENLVSNNEAEYAALHLSLLELEHLNVHHLPVRFFGDSNVVINQMSGDWPESILSGWAERIDGKLQDLGIQAEFELVPRKANAEADRLATQALKGIEIIATSEMTTEL